MQVKITGLTEMTIRIERIYDDGVTLTKVYDADFYATADEQANLVSIDRVKKPSMTITVVPSELEINGEVPASAEEAAMLLNEFIGNFSPGGSSPSTTALSVTKSGINGETIPAAFSWITGLEVSEVRLMSNAAGISFRTGGESYDKDTLPGVRIPAGEELSITGIEIKAGESQANVIILFKKIKS